MKKTLAITTVTLLIICFSTMNAYADNKTMEGVFIVAGVTILSAAIISGMNTNHRPSYSTHHSAPPILIYTGYNSRHNTAKYNKLNSHHSKGKQWIEPVYNRKWNSGHSGRRGAMGRW